MTKEQVKNALRFALVIQTKQNDEALFGCEITGCHEHTDGEYMNIENALNQFAEAFIAYNHAHGIS